MNSVFKSVLLSLTFTPFVILLILTLGIVVLAACASAIFVAPLVVYSAFREGVSK